ncbi:MAG TPA: AAA-like domain-containing protein, partial [Chthonomonadaceae bacterium]|nr:AAA-like domain-containing protein [Chthonomonadaceae bacterium]
MVRSAIEPDDGALEIRLFGPPDVRVDGKPLMGLHSRKGYSLLALLVLRQDREVTREWLSGTLWPESTQSRAFYNLRENLTDLRRALGREATRLQAPTRQTLVLDLNGVWVDVLEFDSTLRQGDPDALTQATALYRGPLMEGYNDEWVSPERQARERDYLRALEALADQAIAGGDPVKAAGHLRQVLAVDPIREDVLCRLLQALAASGDHAGGIAAYRAFRLLLHHELNADPSAETIALFRRLRQEATAAPLTSRPPLPNTEPRHPPTEAAVLRLESVGGAVPLDSAFYIVRPADGEFKAAIAGRESIVLVKGARQVGKTSLLARGLQQARESGARIALTDLQTLNERHLTSADALCLALAKTLALQLDLTASPGKSWDPDLGASLNLEWFVRDQILKMIPETIVWGLDEVDRLFTCRFGSEIFGLFRSWHNRRALDPTGPWSRLTLAIAYATEAHLFITDLNQSPFNVGARLTLEDFTPEQVEALNRCYGAPLRNADELERFYRLLGGQPYLTRQGLYEMATQNRKIADLEAQADQEEGPFGDHLRRLLFALSQ